jgi:hypothetical protein
MNLLNLRTTSNNKRNNYTDQINLDIARIINKEYFNSFSKIVICNLCGNILNNAHDCDKCGNSFCFECISNYKCPFNCHNNKIKQSSQGIKLMLSNLLFKCDLSTDCKEEIPYNDIPIHEMNCDYKIVVCFLCRNLVKRKEFERHVNNEECEGVSNVFMCDECILKISIENVLQHKCKIFN